MLHTFAAVAYQLSTPAQDGKHTRQQTLETTVKQCEDKVKKLTLADKPLMRVLPFSSFTSAVSSYISSSELHSTLHMHRQNHAVGQAPGERREEGASQESLPHTLSPPGNSIW